MTRFAYDPKLMAKKYRLNSAPRSKPVQREHAEQSALFTWMLANRAKHPALSSAFAIPNAGGFSGGFKHNVGRVKKLQAEGVKKGVPDIFVPWPSSGSQWPNKGGYGGMFIEMKSGKGKATSEQIAYVAQLNDAGYFAIVCYSWQEAAREICGYLSIDPRTCGL